MTLLRMLSGVILDDLADFDRDAFLAAGLSTARVGELNLVHTTYFGPTKTTGAAQNQREAAETA